MDSRAKFLLELGDKMFSQRSALVGLWQETALHFYPERADFYGDRGDEGSNFAEHLFSSYPVLARRQLGNLVSTMLRPRERPWFSVHVQDEDQDRDPANRRYLEYVDGVMRRAMYDPVTQSVKATKQADHDYITFGNAVIQVRPNANRDALFYQSHHIRDCVWSENAEGKVDHFQRKWRPTVRQLIQLFGDKVSQQVKDMEATEPERVVECRYIVCPPRLYRQDKGRRKPAKFTALYVECESQNVLQEIDRNWFGVVIPRWHTVSGSPYARSPATEAVLPDARTLQAVVRTLREAGEMHVNPPLAAVQEAIRSDIGYYAGGITWLDAEYDERLGAAIRPLVDGRPGTMPIGLDVAQDLRETVRNGFFLDILQLPEIGKDMTAYEVSRRVEEHVRSSAPLFEPIEEEYNAPLCNETFEVLKAEGAFGPPGMVPEGLRDADIRFTFQSPLRDVSERARSSQFIEGLGVLGQAAQIDPSQIANVEMTPAVRDSLAGIGWPATWLADPANVDAMRAQLQQQKTFQEGLGTLQAGTAIAKQAGDAAQQLQGVL